MKRLIFPATLTVLLLASCGGGDQALPEVTAEGIDEGIEGTEATPEMIKVKGQFEHIPMEEIILAESNTVAGNVAYVPIEDLHSERHEVIRIEDGWIKSRNLSGDDYSQYMQDYFEMKGVSVEEGDIVEIYWTKADIEAGRWDVIYVLKKL